MLYLFAYIMMNEYTVILCLKKQHFNSIKRKKRNIGVNIILHSAM